MRGRAACSASKATIDGHRFHRLQPSGKGAEIFCLRVLWARPPVTVVLLPGIVVLRPVTSRVRPPGMIEVHRTEALTADHAVSVAVFPTVADMRILIVEDDKDLQRLLKKAKRWKRF